MQLYHLVRMFRDTHFHVFVNWNHKLVNALAGRTTRIVQYTRCQPLPPYGTLLLLYESHWLTLFDADSGKQKHMIYSFKLGLECCSYARTKVRHLSCRRRRCCCCFTFLNHFTVFCFRFSSVVIMRSFHYRFLLFS